MTAEMAQNCPTCNPSPNARTSELGPFLPQRDEASGPALGVELSDSSAQGATTPDPAEAHVDGWRVRVIEWGTDETVKVVQCKGEREAKKIERGMGINMASEYYTEIDNKPRTTTTTTTPDPVSEAAKVLEKSRTARKAAFDEMWKVATEEFSLEATNNGGARYSITGDVINALWYAAIRALTKDGEDG
jgi:hypothetical protein